MRSSTGSTTISRSLVMNCIALVTALNPVLGYETCSMPAKEAMEQGKGIYDLVLEKKLLTKEELNEIMRPENMISPRRPKPVGVPRVSS